MDGVSGPAVRLTLQVNAQAPIEVPILADGTFTWFAPAVFGLNLVQAELVDERENRITASRSFHYAGDFFSLDHDTQGRSMLESSLQVWLTDTALDRGTPGGAPPYDPCWFDAGKYTCAEIRDLATVQELALNSLDFTALSPGSQFNFPLVDEAWHLKIGDLEIKATWRATSTWISPPSRWMWAWPRWRS